MSNAGVIVTHIGGLLLLLGGLLTSVNSLEGVMVIYEGETSNFITDYHIRELAVYELSQDTKKVFSAPFEKLRPGTIFNVSGLPLKIEILYACRNCDVSEQGKNIEIKSAKLEKEDEQNKSGVEFKVSGADTNSNGVYSSLDYLDAAPTVKLDGKSYKIALEKQHTYLPFALMLRKFDKQFHPGTEIARSYESFITLKDGVTEWPSIIQMNEPLRYRGYTFYQSSFIEDEGKKATVLAVVKNAGRMFPYISGIVICIGLILHMALRLPKLISGIIAGRAKKTIIFMIILFALVPHHAHAAISSEFDYTAFKTIPVLDQGRVKPVSTVAQNYLKQFYGKSSLPYMTAIDWFAELLFMPEDSYNRKVFNISDPHVVDALGLEHRSPHYYSYHEVGEGLLDNKKAWQGLFDLPEGKLTSSQRELIGVYNNVETFSQLSRALSLFFPEFHIPSGPIATALGVLPGSNLTYVEMLPHQDALDGLGRRAMEQSRKNPEWLSLLSPSDARGIVRLEKQLDTFGDDRQNDAFKIIPPPWDNEKAGKLWYAPWGITFQGQGSPEVVKFLSFWKDLVAAYRHGDASGFLSISESINEESLHMAGDAVSEPKIRLEVIYNDYQPFKISMGFYGLAFVLVVISLMFRGNRLYYASAGCLLVGFVFHGIGLLARMLIMGRPPVTNLYASIIFVGFMVALTAIIYEWRMRNRIGVIVAAIAGLVLQFLGLSYDAEGETMGMLVAVLDTNFWLSTHVVCMTTGYACCILGSIMAHVYLVLRIVRPEEGIRLEELSRNIRGVSYLALMFSSVGTILGGIWADQSWGRFWGWDPKENGALLICLWLLFIIHGRMAKRFHDLGFNIGMAMTSIAVSLAWFGVNLLAVGLHSYGFTEGTVTGLVSFIAGEMMFAVASYIMISKRQARISS
jgi:ABC-type transport system involved in cytochrome c biogenesis permease subunit